MDNSFSSDAEDVNDLLIEGLGLDLFEEEELEMADSFIEDPASSVLSFPSNSNNLDVPIHDESINQPFSLQYPILDSNPIPKAEPIPSPSYPSTSNVSLADASLNHPYPSNTSALHPTLTLPQPHLHFAPLNYSLPSNDSLNYYWNSINPSVENFFNFNHGNVSMPQPQSHAAHHPTANAYSVPVFNTCPSTAINATSTTNETPVEQEVKFAVYEKEKGKTSQMCRRFPRILPVDNTRDTVLKGGRQQLLWFFILRLLGDVSKKSIIQWTGYQRHFKVKDTRAVCELWARHKNTNVVSSWDTLARTLRTWAAKGIVMAVPASDHKGHNVDGLYAFVIEPAFYLGMSREELDQFIMENCENGSAHQSQPPLQSIAAPMMNQTSNQPINTQSQLNPSFNGFHYSHNYPLQYPVIQSHIPKLNVRYAPY